MMYHVRAHFGEFRQDKGQDFRFYVLKEHTLHRLIDKIDRLRQALSNICKELDISIQEGPLSEAHVKIFCNEQYAEIVVPLVALSRLERLRRYK